MSLKERVYSVLAVSSSEKFRQALPELFGVPTFSPVVTAVGAEAAKRALMEREFDIVVVNSPLSDGSGTSLAVDAVSSGKTTVLFLSRAEQFDETFSLLAPRGVFVVQKPVSRSVMNLISGWLVSARENLRNTEKKTLSIEEKMTEIRFVNRAKWLLITKKRMSEPDAHRFVEKSAMDQCRSKLEVARDIIESLSKEDSI